MDFETCAVQWRPWLVRSAALMGCSTPDAEDAAQVTLMKCFKSWALVSAAERPNAYVYRILLYTVRSEAKARSKEIVGVEVTERDIPYDPDFSLGLSVRTALLTLSQAHREVLVLRYYCDLSEQETAMIVRRPRGTVKSRTARALRDLAVALEATQRKADR